jgi:hypothetical protein
MQTKRREVFTTIRTEGALLPSDFLARMVEGGNDIKGLTPEAYHLVPGEKINEAINRSWNRLVGAWTSFRSAVEKLPPDDPATGVTRERWLLHLFQELDYGRLQTSKAVEIEGKTYPISHSWERVPIHLVGCGVQLDRVTAGVAGAARSSPHSLLQEFLNRSKERLWGFVSNGLRLRILRDNISLTRQAFVEFDLESMMNGEVYSDFTLLWLLCHQSRVEADRPELCRLEEWSKAAQDQGTRSLDQLRNGVEEAIAALGKGFLAHPANTILREKLRSGGLSGQDLYRQLLRTVYRLLFLFVAEDRDLLLDPSGSQEAKGRYLNYYSMARLRKLAERRKGTKHHDIWKGADLVFRMLGDVRGCQELALTPLGSFLWSEKATPDIVGCEISNSDLLDAIRSLAFTIDKNVRRAVDYKNLGSEELGSIYESLMELHPVLNGDAATFRLETAGGHERKTTGSYYTPSSLINCLLDSALDPVLEEATKKDDPEKALLDLKVCDPACGSGHFLIAAAHRIAKKLAAVRTGAEEPSPDATRAALREVIGRCIYGVDINPMAVELCKVSLWMESLEPGKPLSFLEHRILCGNSLLGATPALLKDGIPDDAFNPIEGDDGKLWTEYKKRNKSERSGQHHLFTLAGEPWERLGDLATSIANLGNIDDSTIDGVKRKQDRYEEIVRSSDYLYGNLWADAWCSAFVWKKVNDPDLPYAITEEIFRKIEKSPYSIPPWMQGEINRLADQYQFFHWHLAFPNIFRVPSDDEDPRNQQTGWSGGFDVVLGNPPWERIKLEEKEWFSDRMPDISNASRASQRRKMINRLADIDPLLHATFAEAKRQAEGFIHFIRKSGRYPLCGGGDLNTYAAFAETKRLLIHANGRIGCILPSGIATDKTTKEFFNDLVKQNLLVSLYDFENRKKIFVGVQGNMKFCLITIGRHNSEFFEVGAQLDGINLVSDPSRTYELCGDEIALINPNTLNLPTFRSSVDANLVKRIHKMMPAVINKTQTEGNPWGISFMTMFHLTNESHLFRTFEELLESGWILKGNVFRKNKEIYIPLYESKFAHQYNHRASTFDGIPPEKRYRTHAGTRKFSEEDLSDIQLCPMPRYWIPYHSVVDKIGNIGWLLGFRDAISAVADSRSFVSAVLPRCGVGNTMPLVFNEWGAIGAAALCSQMNSFILDYVLRQKASGGHVNYYIFEQLPFLPPKQFQSPPAWDATHDLFSWIGSRFLELTYTAWDVRDFAIDVGYAGPPFVWNSGRRFLLKCELDSAYFHLYGIESNEIEHVMDTFPVVRRRDEQQFNEYRTKRVILEIYDAMANAMRTGRPYKTALSPRPADPQGGHQPR